MGSAVTAQCTCGYSCPVLIGEGMATFKTTCYFPCLCETCGAVVQVNFLAILPKCPSYNTTEIVPYDDPKVAGKPGKKNVASWTMKDRLGRVLVLTDGTYRCPSCREISLEFRDTGLCWD